MSISSHITKAFQIVLTIPDLTGTGEFDTTEVTISAPPQDPSSIPSKGAPELIDVIDDLDIPHLKDSPAWELAKPIMRIAVPLVNFSGRAKPFSVAELIVNNIKTLLTGRPRRVIAAVLSILIRSLIASTLRMVSSDATVWPHFTPFRQSELSSETYFSILAPENSSERFSPVNKGSVLLLTLLAFACNSKTMAEALGLSYVEKLTDSSSYRHRSSVQIRISHASSSADRIWVEWDQDAEGNLAYDFADVRSPEGTWVEWGLFDDDGTLIAEYEGHLPIDASEDEEDDIHVYV